MRVARGCVPGLGNDLEHRGIGEADVSSVPPGHARSGIQITQFRHDTDGRWQTCHWHTETAGRRAVIWGVRGASQQARYGLLDDRLFCIFIHCHPLG